jgi:hypothetical protein
MNTIKTFFKENTSSIIIAGALILAVIIGGIFYATKGNGGNTLTVTGSTRMAVTSDSVIWKTSISRDVATSNLKSGYTQLDADIKIVQAFLVKNNIDPKSVVIAPVSANPDYNQGGGAPQSYMLKQSIEIDSSDVNAITTIAKNIGDVVNQGVLFQTDSIEYYYSKLDDARVSLLTAATDDARARATAMAKSSHQSIGKLQSASSGVVQVLSRGAVDSGDYGQYDTSKIEKDITVTVRATFRLR